MTLRLARVQGNEVVPYATEATPDLSWALSEVRVAANRVAEVPIPPKIFAAAQKARSGWGRWERESVEVKLIVLQSEGERMSASVVDKRGRTAYLYYAHDAGLFFA